MIDLFLSALAIACAILIAPFVVIILFVSCVYVGLFLSVAVSTLAGYMRERPR